MNSLPASPSAFISACGKPKASGDAATPSNTHKGVRLVLKNPAWPRKATLVVRCQLFAPAASSCQKHYRRGRCRAESRIRLRWRRRAADPATKMETARRHSRAAAHTCESSSLPTVPGTPSRAGPTETGSTHLRSASRGPRTRASPAGRSSRACPPAISPLPAPAVHPARNAARPTAGRRSNTARPTATSRASWSRS